MSSDIRFAAGAFVLAAAVFAAPLAKAAPANVAAGFPDWTNVDKKHHMYGRDLTASDLRHKFTVVVEMDAKDRETGKKQIETIVPLLWLNSFHHSSTIQWDTYVMPRNVQVVVACFGMKDAAELTAAISLYSKEAKGSTPFGYVNPPFYSGLTFPGAPSGAGKRPFFYVMGPEGTTPLISGTVDAKSPAAIKASIAKVKLPKWVPFFGSVGEPTHFPTLKKAIDPAKPKLAAEMPKLKKGIASKDPEVAKEAQILYDAIEQTKSDLIYKIRFEIGAAPHVAAYDIERLVKFWPSEKKNVTSVMERLKAKPEIAKAAQMYVKMRTWADPDFAPKNAGEAKKIVAELNQMKALLDKMADNAKDTDVQGAASLVGAEIDGLIETIPSKVK